MKKQDYTTKFATRKTVDEVFNCINQVSAWWTENIEGSSDKLNDVFKLHFAETFVTIQIAQFDPGKKVVWLVNDCYLHWLKDKTEWKNTQMLFEISTQKHETLLQFTHVGLAPEVECYKDCVKGWNQYINESLYNLITEGKGKPEIKKMETSAATL